MINDLKNKDLSYKDSFNLGFDIYRANFRTIAVLTALVYVPILLIERLIIFESLMDIFVLLGAGREGITYGDVSMDIVFGLILDMDGVNLPAGVFMADIRRSLYIILGALMVSGSLILPLLSSGVTYLLLNSDSEEENTADKVLNTAVSNIGKTFITTLLASAFISMGLMLFILPGIYLYVAYAFIIPAIIVTGKWGFGALKESLLSVKGRWFRTLLFLVLVNVFSFFLMYLASFITEAVRFLLPVGAFTDSILSIAVNIARAYFVLVQCLWFVNKYFTGKRHENSL